MGLRLHEPATYYEYTWFVKIIPVLGTLTAPEKERKRKTLVDNTQIILKDLIFCLGIDLFHKQSR